MRITTGPQQSLDWLYEVRNGRAFSLYSSQIAVAGEFSLVQLLNPMGSGKTVLVYEARASRTNAGYVQLSSYATALTTLVGNGANLKIGGAASAAEVRRATNVAQIGAGITVSFLAANVTALLAETWFAELDEGEGVILVMGTVNEQLNGAYRWVER